MDVVQIALKNIFEPMPQSERNVYISFLRTHFESNASECEGTPDPSKVVASSKKGVRFFRKGGSLPYYLKVITGFDETKKGGYCFEGSFFSQKDAEHLPHGTPVLVGTSASPKKYALAKADRHAELTFEDAAGKKVNVKGLSLVCVDSDVRVLIDALKSCHLLKS